MGGVAVITIRPVTGLRLHGAGDRTARSPGPGVVLGEEPILPRIETVLGLLAAKEWWGTHGRCSDWGDCVLKKALEGLCGNDEGAKVFGPFLVNVGDREPRVFINAGTGLLSVSGVKRYVEVAKNLMEAAQETRPGRRKELKEVAISKLEELMERRDFIPAEEIAQKMTGIAINPRQRVVEHGLIYSYAYIDYRGAVGKSLITVIVAGCTHPRERSFNAVLGPKSAPVAVAVSGTNLTCLITQSAESPHIALTPAPIEGLDTVEWAIHPRPPSPPLEVIASSYSTDGEKFLKTDPKPALWPGTVIKWRRISSGAVTHSLDEESLLRVGKALSNLFRTN